MKSLSLRLPGAYLELQLSHESPEAQGSRENAEFRRTNIYFSGDYAAWREALADASGYDAPVILQKAITATRAVLSGKAAYERDTVLFETAHVAHPLLFALLYTATQYAGCLKVLDFGGALGTSYHQSRPFLSHLDMLHWGVVEQESFVTAGKEEFETEALRFFPSVDACMEAVSPNFLLMSGVLQYLETPYSFLDVILSKGIPHVFVDRTMAHRLGRDRLVVQHVPEWIYEASYPVWLMDADRMEELFDSAGYDILDQFDPHPGATFGHPDFKAPYIGWFLRKRQ